ncbi:MAG: peptidoglycan bridge formation glycyltransferase FemA/FemB family protein, partial [Patescibacteria group bacterium]
MKIVFVRNHEKQKWNEFVCKHYPPVGGFMQSWEWGIFQEKLGHKVERYFIFDNHSIIGAFTLIYYSLTLGLQYGYMPRGPIIINCNKNKCIEIYSSIHKWTKTKLPYLIFLRLEPPVDKIPQQLIKNKFN